MCLYIYICIYLYMFKVFQSLCTLKCKEGPGLGAVPRAAQQLSAEEPRGFLELHFGTGRGREGKTSHFIHLKGLKSD